MLVFKQLFTIFLKRCSIGVRLLERSLTVDVPRSFLSFLYTHFNTLLFLHFLSCLNNCAKCLASLIWYTEYYNSKKLFVYMLSYFTRTLYKVNWVLECSYLTFIIILLFNILYTNYNWVNVPGGKDVLSRMFILIYHS
jgi:hypothetical protein